MEGRGGFMVPPMAAPPELIDLQDEYMKAHRYLQDNWEEQLAHRWQQPIPKKQQQQQQHLQQQQQSKKQPRQQAEPPPPPILPPALPGGGLPGVLEARVLGWDLGACAKAQGVKGYAAVCGSAALSDNAGEYSAPTAVHGLLLQY
eukprot:1074435-Pelagomonas_calceolata.AAC.2